MSALNLDHLIDFEVNTQESGHVEYTISFGRYDDLSPTTTLTGVLVRDYAREFAERLRSCAAIIERNADRVEGVAPMRRHPVPVRLRAA